MAGKVGFLDAAGIEVEDITKRLMELHGGSIDLSSEAGYGTRVVLRFPASRIRQYAEAQSA